jgi:hypothetical protein
MQEEVRQKCIAAFPQAQRLKAAFSPPDRAWNISRRPLAVFPTWRPFFSFQTTWRKRWQVFQLDSSFRLTQVCLARKPVSACDVLGTCPYGYAGISQARHFRPFYFQRKKTTQMLLLTFCILHAQYYGMRFVFSWGSIYQVFGFNRVSFVIFFFRLLFLKLIHFFLSFLSTFFRLKVQVKNAKSQQNMSSKRGGSYRPKVVVFVSSRLFHSWAKNVGLCSSLSVWNTTDRRHL